MMKKLTVLTLAFFMMFSIAACMTPLPAQTDGRTGESLELNFDKDNNYTGFQTLPLSYTSEQAIEDGCYIRKILEEAGGDEAWKSFIENSKNGKDASLRIMFIYDDDIFYHDLFYFEGYYRIFDSGSENLEDRKFKYLKDLNGRLPNAAKDSRYVVLTDDEDLTFTKVSSSFYSSNLAVIQAVSPFRIVFLEVKD